MEERISALMDVFKKNYLVHGLPQAAVDAIAELATYHVATAGEHLVRIGDKGSDLFIILEGHVNIYSADGDKLSTAEPPSILGEIALVDDQERSADAVCVGLVKYARIPGKELRQYMWQNKETGFVMLANLCRVLSMRLRKTNVVVIDLMGKSQDLWKHVT